MNYIAIKEQKTFTAIYRRGKPFHGEVMTLLVMPCEVTQSAFVASRKVGNAVCRNLVKRRLRALFDVSSKNFPRASYLWIAKPAIKSATFSVISSEVALLGERASKTLNIRK